MGGEWSEIRDLKRTVRFNSTRSIPSCSPTPLMHLLIHPIIIHTVHAILDPITPHIIYQTQDGC